MKQKAAIIFILLTGLISCRKDETNFDGPGIVDIYRDFKIIEKFDADRDSVNFDKNETV